MNGLSRAVLFAEICFEEVDSRNVLRSLESTVLPAAPSKVVIKFLTLRRAMTVLGAIQGHSFEISIIHRLLSVIYFPLYVILLSCLGSEQPHGLHVVTVLIECGVCLPSNYTGFYIKCNLLRNKEK